MTTTRRNLLLAGWIALVVGVVIWAQFFQGSRLWERDINMGLEAMNERRYDDADRHFRAAVQRAQHFGPSDKRLGLSLLDLAELRKDQGKYTESEDLFRQALRIFDATGVENAQAYADA